MQESLFSSEIIERTYSFRSPLRYPGGKTRAIEILTRYFPKNLDTLCSPFFGGGSVELYLAARGVKVFGYDVFKPLVEFWQSLLTQPDELADTVERFFPLEREKFYELQRQQTLFESALERAAVYYVLNRSSFSGATLSGGMSPEHPRFTRTSIERLRSFHNPNLDVRELRFNESLLLHTDTFAYLDPPYLVKSGLYGRKGDVHKSFDHETLAAILRTRDKWIMSYNDCPEIRALYAGYRVLMPNWKYGMSNDKASREILIFSHDL